jgi:hypothetical protein
VRSTTEHEAALPLQTALLLPELGGPRLAERVAYLVDEVPPRVPVRQRIPTVSSASRDRGSSPFTRTPTERRGRAASQRGCDLRVLIDDAVFKAII